VAAERRGGRMTVWASWNGATEVARWEVLGDGGAVVASGRRRGFETELSARRSRSVTVRALDASGNVLGSSRTIRP
jgi:hypothetical protein